MSVYNDIKMRILASSRFNEFITHLYKVTTVRMNRQRWTMKTDFKNKQVNTEPITESQKKEILAFWSKYQNLGDNICWFDFYNACSDDKSQLKYFIPDSFFYRDIDLFFTHSRRSMDIDDKNLYDLYFRDVKMPLSIVRKTFGVLMDKDYRMIDINNALHLCKEYGKVICKKSCNSSGGAGIRFFDFSTCSDEEFKSWLNGTDEIIIQEIIQQHESLSAIHFNSINTIRIMSLTFDNEVHLLSGVLRMGRDGAHVDNASSGGIVCGIDENGRLKEFAYNTKGNRWTQHPQGLMFKGYMIPGYDKCCEQIKSLAGRLVGISKLISWDYAIGIDGQPILIEVNLTYGQVDFHQMCNGPIFGNLTESVLSLIYHKNN